MYRIAKEFGFSASHQLPHLGPEHKCARLHGHNYTVTVFLSSPVLDERGFIVDFAELAPVKAFLDSCWDHRHLNDCVPVPPTSEHLARFLFDWCRDNLPLPGARALEAVRVSESGSTWAEYQPDPPEALPQGGATGGAA
ncbi:6-pyruvoyl trahydropterin synthase family protein [Nocardiopsis dassonvillei]|uniref:6-pyruvoyl trahydropterin synthase family protein n=1 Tax=Nocardiopsis dassonvillei TaxID=2014 RepID=UPI0003490C3C|nr:6-carboxytetrahydropterin synthase [Nocardiopsis dassonvillei]MCK9872400.1 6-carboxytetrahydropterin synthase [Nocardiopsis dassonvillei]